MSKDKKNGVITHKMSFKTRILCCVLMIMSVLGFVNVLYNIKSSKALDLQALAPYRSMCVISEDGQVLNQYNKDQQLAMASTTKIVTAIVTIENCDDLDEIITVDDKSVGIEGTSIYLRKKEQMSIRNLLYGLILASGNDAAMALACAIGGNKENFVEMMNKFALDLDLKNTHFANPHGLDAKGHYTSTYDLAVITNYALDNPVFKEIVSTKTKILNEGEPNVRYLRNKNKLLFSQDGCVGVKTGFTDNAGRCLVNACERNGFRVVSVVFNCGPMFEECDKLTEQAYNEYMVKTFVEPYNFVGNVSVIDGDKNEAFVVTIKGYSKIIKKSEEDMYKVDYDILETAEAPINANTKMGAVKVTYNDEIIYEDGLYSTSEIKNINIKYKLDTIIKSWFI